MSGFTDYHAHFVYGVDDGAQTREEMYAMLDAAAADGVRHLFATSHSTPGMERFPQEVYDRHLALARAYCTQKGYDLKLEHGSELLYTPATGYAAVQRQLLTFRGEYMTQYSWAEVTHSALRQQANVQKTASIPSYYVPPTGF